MKSNTIHRLLIISVPFFSLLIFCGCNKNPVEPEIDLYDYSYIKHYRSDFDESKFTIIRENKYSRLLLMPNLITEIEAVKLSVNTDTMISRVCFFLNTSIGEEYKGFKGKVSYFLEPNVMPRCYSGSPIPVVSLTTTANLYSMYNHETVHIFSMKTSALWLIEGLAVHLADSIGVEELWPNYSENLHRYARHFISNQEALEYIGVNRFFWIDPATTAGKAFYSLSGSFVRYLIYKMGKLNFLTCYSSSDFKSSLYIATQKTFDDWKKEWLNFLNNIN